MYNKEYHKEWAKKNRKYRQMYLARWRRQNAEKVKSYAKKYYASHKTTKVVEAVEPTK